MGRRPGPNRSGLDFENAVALKFRLAGFDDARRLGTGAHGDVVAGPMLVECKNQKNPPSIRLAFDQARGAIFHHEGLSVPVAVCKTKGDPAGTLATMLLDDLLKLLADARDGRPAW